MEAKKYPVFFNKCNNLQINTIDRFRERINNLQVRLTDFAYFHSNDEDNSYSDLTEKSRILYKNTEKILSSIFESFTPDETNPILTKNESINYIKDVYKEVKDKKSIFYEVQNGVKKLCQSRDANEFKEIFSSSDICLNVLGIELNSDENKIFKNNLDKLLQNKSKIENPVSIDKDFEPSEEKEFLLGQVLSEYCLYNSIKLLKKSKSNFKDSCKKIDDAYKTDVENSFMQLQNQVTALITENEKLIQINEKNEIKLKDNEIQIEELQELLDLKNTQIKKLSDEIMELKGNASTPEIIYNLGDSSDECDTSEILKFLTETEPDENTNQNITYRPQNIIPPSLDTEFEVDMKPNMLTIPKAKPFAKKDSENNIKKQEKKEVIIDDSTNDAKTRSVNNDNSLLLKQLEDKDMMIQKLRKNITNLAALYRKTILL